MNRSAHRPTINARTTRLTRIACGLRRFVLLLALSVLPLWAAETVTLTPSTTTPAVGSSFTVTVTLSDAAPFANWATYLAWDPAKVQLTGQATGSFTTFIPDSRDLATINSTGEVRAGGFGFTDNAGGTGTLGVFTFTALVSGTTDITTEAKSGTNLFGLALSTAAGVERVPGVPGPLSLTIGGGALAPELDVTRSGAVADGGTDPVTGTTAGTATSLTYTLTNSGSATLTISGATTVAGQSNCIAMVSTQPASSVAAAGSTSLVVAVTPTAAGAWSFTLSTPNNDADENPYNWTVQGVAAAGKGNAISVSGAGGGGCGSGLLSGLLLICGLCLCGRRRH
jgi:hypothetical protein